LIRFIQKLIIENQITLVHAHNVSLLGSLIPAMRPSRGIPLVVSQYERSSKVQHSIWKKLLLERVDGLFVSSESMAGNVQKTIPIKPKKIAVVGPGVDLRPFEDLSKRDGIAREVKRQLGVDGDEVLVGVTGRLDPMKGQSLFVKAAAGVLKLPRKVKFIVVGDEVHEATHGLKERLENLVRQFRIEDRVLFKTTKELPLETARQAIDILVIPSEESSLGFEAYEAMASGKPVILSRNGTSRELVGDEDRGLLFRSGDAFSLEQAIGQLLDSPGRWKEMGQRARRYVFKNCALDSRLIALSYHYNRYLQRRARWRPSHQALKSQLEG